MRGLPLCSNCKLVKVNNRAGLCKSCRKIECRTCGKKFESNEVSIRKTRQCWSCMKKYKSDGGFYGLAEFHGKL